MGGKKKGENIKLNIRGIWTRARGITEGYSCEGRRLTLPRRIEEALYDKLLAPHGKTLIYPARNFNIYLGRGRGSNENIPENKIRSLDDEGLLNAWFSLLEILQKAGEWNSVDYEFIYFSASKLK